MIAEESITLSIAIHLDINLNPHHNKATVKKVEQVKYTTTIWKLILLYIIIITIIIIKGSWEAILPSYEWLLLDGIDYDEGWCASETWPWNNTSQTDWPWWRVVWDFTLQNNTSQTDWPWWRVVWDFTLQNNTSQKDWPRWRVVWDFTLQNNTSQTGWPWWRVVWDFTLQNNTSQKDWPRWRVVWDFTLHNKSSQTDWPWWRVVWDFTLHNKSSQKDWPWWRVVWDFTLHNNTSQKDWPWWRVVWDMTLHNNTSQKDWPWWRVVWDLCGGCGWGRLVPSMCFATMVVPVCVVPCVSWSCGCRSHWNGCMNVACCVLWGGSRSTKPCVFPCKVAAAGDERYLVCAAGAAGVVWFLLCVLQQWLFLCA